jgi:uroporphyrinogen decarboxylase
MTSRERVQAAFAYVEPDCTPCDYFGTPEIHRALLDHFGVTSDDDLQDRLGTDIRIINPPYTGPSLEPPPGCVADIWGVVRKPMPNEYGEYAEPVNLPYAEWTTVEQAEQFDWPSPDWYDYDAIPTMCEAYPDRAIGVGSFGVQDFINGVAFGRGVEQVLMDIAFEDPVYLYIVEQRHTFYLEHVERMLDAGGGRIDLVLCGDDFGTQRAPLISGETFNRLFASKKKALFDLAHSYGAKITHHCCGSSRMLIPQFIECEMDSLQTIQPQAAGMNPYDLKREFAGRIVLHGGVDVQGGLQRATPAEVEQEIHHLIDEVGKDGGYILGPCHNIQPDTPLDNVLALYRAAAERRS